MSETDVDTYALKAADADEIDAPELPYQPPGPVGRCPRIALVGAGGIAAAHLDAYRTAGFDVAVICNRTLERAVARRDEFFPQAEVSDDISGTLARDDIEVVDITLHPVERFSMIERALNAGKHVLSQKPFVLDLDAGSRLADLADAQGVMLAVNQNGRWAPHLSWIREAVRTGLIGDLQSCHANVQWDHGWVAGTPFDDVEDLILYDFAIHWFDFFASLDGPPAETVFARTSRAASQSARPDLLAEAVIGFSGGQASLVFDGATKFGAHDRTIVTGSKGMIASQGPDLNTQAVTMTTEAGLARPTLEGAWFNDGFRGTMGALLQAIETGAQPLNNARDNLGSLAIAFAAIASARRGIPMVPGSVRSIAEARQS